MLAYTFVEQGRFELREKPRPEYDLADWVLGRFPKEQEPALKTALEHATAAVRLLVEGKTDEAMNLYNR